MRRRNGGPGSFERACRLALYALVTFVSLSLGLAITAFPVSAQIPAGDARAQLQVARARLDSVSRAGDAVANTDAFTADAIVSMGTLPDIRGSRALLEAMKSFYERYVVTAHQLQPAEVEVYGDTAYERGTWLFISGVRGQQLKTERGRYAAVWHRGADGRWRIHRYLENLLPIPESR